MDIQTLTTKQMMDALHYRSRESFFNNMWDGDIPMGAKIGGEWRWSKKAVEEWIAAGMPKQTGERS